MINIFIFFRSLSGRFYKLRAVLSAVLIFVFILSCTTDSKEKIKKSGGDSAGKIATISTSADLKKVLSNDDFTTVKIKSGFYEDDYEINDPKFIISEPGSEINKITVNTDGTKIQSPSIRRLTVSSGVGDGELVLEDVTVKEEALFQGGGSNSIKAIGNTVFLGVLIMDKEDLSLKLDSTANLEADIQILKRSRITNLKPEAVTEIKGTVTMFAEDAAIDVKVGTLIAAETVKSIKLGTDGYIGKIISLSQDIVVTKDNENITNQITTGDITEIDDMTALNIAYKSLSFNYTEIKTSSIVVTDKITDPRDSSKMFNVIWRSSHKSVSFSGNTASIDLSAFNSSDDKTVKFYAKLVKGDLETREKEFTSLVFSENSDPEPTTYTVSFVTNFTGTIPSVEYTSGDKIPTPGTLTREGYTFAGWYKEAACVNLWNFLTDTVQNNITLYAKWLSNTKQILTFGFVSPEVVGVVNHTDGKITVTLPIGSSSSSLTAVFTTSGVSVKTGTIEQISGTTANNFTSPVIYTVTAEDGSSKEYVVTVDVMLTDSKDITAFGFLTPSVSGSISGTDISVQVPFGTDISGLKAIFSSTGSSITVAGIQQTSGVTVNNFTSPVVYRVTAADSSFQDYTVTVTILPPEIGSLSVAVTLLNPSQADISFSGSAKLSKSGSRGLSKTMTVSVTSGLGTYNWYLNGETSAGGMSVVGGTIVNIDSALLSLKLYRLTLILTDNDGVPHSHEIAFQVEE